MRTLLKQDRKRSMTCRSISTGTAKRYTSKKKNTSVVTEEEMVNNRPTPDRVSAQVLAEEFPKIVAELHHGDILIAAITSCTNTSNPSVMNAAGLLAKKAVDACADGEALLAGNEVEVGGPGLRRARDQHRLGGVGLPRQLVDGEERPSIPMGLTERADQVAHRRA